MILDNIKLVRITIAVACLAGSEVPAHAGSFEGKLEFMPPRCEQTLLCKLKNDFGYVDSKGTGWQAKAGDETDGASIPAWAQPFVGGQFASEFIKAAVIHDHYCGRHVRPWRQTHWVFYDALIASSVDKSKALLMYFAVYLGGPKWIKLIEGNACQVGKNCIERLPDQHWPEGATKIKDEKGEEWIFRKSQYDDPMFEKYLRDTEAMIAEKNGNVSLEELEHRAKSIKVGDFFYATGDSMMIQTPVGVEK